MTNQKSFKLQLCGSDRKTVRVSIPRQIVLFEANKYGITLDEFVKQFQVHWINNKTGHALVTFVRVDSKKKEDGFDITSD